MRKESYENLLWGFHSDMFRNMRSLHLTHPDITHRNTYVLNGENRKDDRCTLHHENEDTYDFVPLRCFSKQWQHVNLRELLIEGSSLGVTIPALPNLETLLISCNTDLALDFVDPKYLGRTITRMDFSAQQMDICTDQKQELYKALSARGLELAGDWMSYFYTRLVAVQTRDYPNYRAAEAVKEYTRGFECTCRACPSCLGIGIKMLEREDPSEDACSNLLQISDY